MQIEVNGIRIDPELIRNHTALLRDQAREEGIDLTPEDGLKLLEEAADFAIRLELVRQEALRKSVTVDHLVDTWCKSVRPPRAKEVREIYVKHREDFWRPPAVFVSHIVKNVNHDDERELLHTELLRIHELLAGGSDFAAVADAHSDCPGDGGRLGYIHRGEMVPEFDEVVFSAALGAITPVFSTRFGLHIALVSEARPEGIRPFEEVAPRIENAIFQEMTNEVVGERIRKLRSVAIVRVVRA